MPRTAVVVIGWAAATAVAVAVAYAGVSVVAGRVVDPLPTSLALQPTVSPSESTTTSTEPTPEPSSPDPTSETVAPASPTATATSAPTTPPPTTSPTTPPTTPPVVSPSPTEDPTPTAQPETRSYALVGGTATLRFEPGRVTLVQAEPAQGFTLDVEGDGTSEITVDFENDDHRSRVKGSWEDGAPRDRVEEDGEGSGSDDGSDDD